jgi:Flp pilus assembly protein TadD
VTIRRLDTGAVLASWKPEAGVWGLAWHPDGSLLAAGTEDRRIYLVDPATGQQRGVLEGHESAVVSLAFNHAGTLLASWGWDGMTRLWDPHGGKELVVARGQCLDFSPDDRSLAYRLAEEVGTWEVAHERVCRTLYGHRGDVSGVQFSPDGHLAASADPDGVRLWDADAGRQLGELPLGVTRTALFHPDGGSLLTPGARGLYRWPLRDIGGEANHRLHLGPPQALPVPMRDRLGQAVCDQHSRRLAVVDAWQKGIVLDLDDPARPALLLGHEHISNIALSPDGRWAATGTFKGADVKVWDLSRGERPSVVHTITCNGAAATFSPDGRWLVVEDGRHLGFYKVGSWEPDPVLGGRAPGGGVPVFAADWPLMVTGVESGKQVELFTSATGRPLATLTPQDSQTILVPRALSRDGTRLAVATSGHAVQLWDLRAVRRHLDEMGLDWGQPAYAPEEADSRGQPLTLEIEGPIPGAPSPPPPDPAEILRAKLALYTLAIARTPHHPEPYHLRGHVLEQLGQQQQAIADFTTAMYWQPPNATQALAHLQASRGISYWRLKEYDRALADLRRAFEMDPESPEVCSWLACAYIVGPANLRDPEQAVALARKAAARMPDEWYVRQTLGMAYYRVGDLERAVVELERSLRAAKEEAGANWFFLAMCHWRLGDKAQARDCHDRAVRWLQGEREKETLAWKAWAERFQGFQAEAEAVMAK